MVIFDHFHCPTVRTFFYNANLAEIDYKIYQKCDLLDLVFFF